MRVTFNPLYYNKQKGVKYCLYPLFSVDHFPDHDLLCAGAEVVHAAEPFHLVLGFQALGDALKRRHFGNRGFDLLPCRAVDLQKMLGQFAGEDEGGQGAVVPLLQETLPDPAVLADGGVGRGIEDQIGNPDVADRSI